MTQAFIELPDIVPAIVSWTTSLDPVTALIEKRIGTSLPDDAVWPAVRLDPIGGIALLEYRIDQPRIQFQCFATTEREAMTVARALRAAIVAMNGLRVPDVLVVTDVSTSTPQIIEAATRDSKLLRNPPVAHATFSGLITVRPDP